LATQTAVTQTAVTLTAATPTVVTLTAVTPTAVILIAATPTAAILIATVRIAVQISAQFVARASARNAEYPFRVDQLSESRAVGAPPPAGLRAQAVLCPAQAHCAAQTRSLADSCRVFRILLILQAKLPVAPFVRDDPLDAIHAEQQVLVETLRQLVEVVVRSYSCSCLFLSVSVLKVVAPASGLVREKLANGADPHPTQRPALAPQRLSDDPEYESPAVLCFRSCAAGLRVRAESRPLDARSSHQPAGHAARRCQSLFAALS